MNSELMLRNVRLAFSDGLVSPKAIAGGKPRYSCNLIIEDPVTLASVQKAIDEIAKSEFQGKAPKDKDCALRDGDDNISKDGEPYKGFAGNHYLSANRAESQGPPLVIDKRRGEITTDRRHAEFPEAGDYVNAKVQLFSLNGKNDKKNAASAAYGKKICCSIEVVQLLKKGEPFGGGGKPSAAGFEDLPEEEEV